MNLRDALLVALKEMGGKVSGKTLLHKRLYLASVLTNEDFGFRSHYYGPYSDDLSNELTQLKIIGALEVSSSPYGVDRSGFEMTRYDYRLTDYGFEAAERAEKKSPVASNAVKSAIHKILAIGDVDYQKLSIAAKVYFILTVEGEDELDEAEIIERARKLNWDLDESQIREAAGYLVKLQLVSS